MLRVLHELPDLGSPAALAEEAARIRELDGCHSAELYRSLVDGENFHAFTMMWEREPQYDAFWVRVLDGEFPALAALVTGENEHAGATEFYAQRGFAVDATGWRPTDVPEQGRAIVWPARGAIRIIIQNAVDATPAMYDKLAVEIRETRREPGCLQYVWCENVDLPGHLLLLEVWADQAVYDLHWALRQSTAAFVGDNLRVPATPRRGGPTTREFYRRQEFTHLYHRWQSAHTPALGNAVVWPAS